MANMIKLTDTMKIMRQDFIDNFLGKNIPDHLKDLSQRIMWESISIPLNLKTKINEFDPTITFVVSEESIWKSYVKSQEALCKQGNGSRDLWFATKLCLDRLNYLLKKENVNELH